MPERSADMILENARVVTSDEGYPDASVVAIRGPDIAFVGDEQEASWRELIGRDTNVVDMVGRTIIPGMVDGHTHPGMVALSSWHISLPRTDDLRAIQDFLRQYAADHAVSEVPFIYAE